MSIETKIKSLFSGLFDDTQAVAPIVATLVLVVVAISGAAAVGTIMGTFSSDVADEASADGITSASSTEIMIAGSTTVQPVSELLAEAYMRDHQGIKITVQGGGSGAGVASTGLDIIDIGAASRGVSETETEKFPYIMTHKIGGSAVVVIGGSNIKDNVSRVSLIDAYTTGSLTMVTGNVTGNVIKLYERAEESGTEDTFTDWLGDITILSSASNIEGATGNAGVLAAVQGNPDSIGFVDYGFAAGAGTTVNILGIIDDGAGGSGETYAWVDVTKANIKTELKKEDGTGYVTELTRPLNYMTNGIPSALEDAFITFAQLPSSKTYFEECGYFAITSFA